MKLKAMGLSGIVLMKVGYLASCMSPHRGLDPQLPKVQLQL